MSDLPAERPEDRPAVRVSDADRGRVHDILAAAMAQGYLSPAEYETRAGQAVEARTAVDLAPLTADLPVDAIEQSVPASAAPGHAPVQRLIAVMSGAELAGDVAVGGTLTAIAFWGGVSIDLRQARFTTGTLEISATAVMGGIDRRTARRRGRHPWRRHHGRLRPPRVGTREPPERPARDDHRGRPDGRGVGGAQGPRDRRAQAPQLSRSRSPRASNGACTFTSLSK